MAGLHDKLDTIAKVIPLGQDGTVPVPDEVIDSTSLRIGNMPPSEVFYASSSSVMYDQHTRALTIDARDFVLPLPTAEQQLLYNPALMRVMKAMGNRVVDGLLVDYRRVRFPRYRDSGLGHGTDSDLYNRLQDNYGTAFPLGAVFVRAGEVVYHGPEELVENVQGMMACIDAYLASVASKLVAFEYFLPADIVRPPKPAAIETLPVPAAPRQETSTEPGDVIGMAILGGAFSVINSALDGLTRRPEQDKPG